MLFDVAVVCGSTGRTGAGGGVYRFGRRRPPWTVMLSERWRISPTWPWHCAVDRWPARPPPGGRRDTSSSRKNLHARLAAAVAVMAAMGVVGARRPTA